MTVRIVSRLILLLVALAAATALMVGALSVLNPDDAAKLLERDQVAAVERAVEAPAEEASGTSPTLPAPKRMSAGTARSKRTTDYQSLSSGEVLTYRVAWRGRAIMGATMSRHR